MIDIKVIAHRNSINILEKNVKKDNLVVRSGKGENVNC
jgi:hypothetical protein